MEIFKVNLIPSFNVVKSIWRFFIFYFLSQAATNDCPSLFSNINKDLLCINLKLLYNIFLALPCPWAFNGSKLWILIKENFLCVWKFTIVGNQEGWFETYIEVFLHMGLFVGFTLMLPLLVLWSLILEYLFFSVTINQ